MTVADRRVKLDLTAILIAAIASIPPTLAAVGALIISLNTQEKVAKVEHATNSMKDALVKAALLEGEVAGVAKEKNRAETEASNKAQGAADEKARRK